MSKWMVKMKKADFDAISGKFGISSITARLLTNRDLVTDEEIEAYLNGDASMLHDPSGLLDADKGAQIMLDRIADGARIRVIGDYDVDGICSSFILVKGLQLFGADVDYVLPDRVKDGYGLSIKLVDEAIAEGRDTIITCDNGIAAVEQIGHAIDQGLTVVVTDHHEVPFEDIEGEVKEILPPANAVIDPKRSGDVSRFKEICGAVVAYKFLQVMAKLSGRDKEQQIKDFFDEMLIFAGIATVCDVMELRDENRIIVKESLRRIADTDNVGLQALINVNKLDPGSITAYHYGFIIGPCLNATGRLDLASRALSLFLEQDRDKAAMTAGDLKDLNDSRKEMTVKGVEEAVCMIEETAETSGIPKVIVVYLENASESIAGIIAGRIKEKYYRPTIVLTKAADGGAKGSGRSIEGYDMFKALTACKELFTKFGGHKMAAGLSLPMENIDELRDRLNEQCTLEDEDFIPKLSIDMVLPFRYADMEMARELEILEPFGNGNTKPLFAQKDIKLLKGKAIGKNKNYGKFKVCDETGTVCDMMYFGDLDDFNGFLSEKFGQGRVDELYAFGGRDCTDPMTIKAAFYPSINSYMGRESLQLVMSDYC
jgi:single-stranded-DNA-specific exonuclease